MIAAVLLATVVASAPLELAPGTRYDARTVVFSHHRVLSDLYLVTALD